MSYFWIFIYLLFVLFVVTIFSWSTIVLQRQKKAWRDFAKKHALVIHKVGFLESTGVEGSYKKNRIGLFSEGKIDETSRGMVKYRTVIEVIFGQGMPGTGALGNMNAMKTIEALAFGPTYHPELDSWNKSHLITCSNRDFIEAYLTKKRLEKLNGFFNMQNATAMMVFDKQDTFLRIETADPMVEVSKIENIMDKLVVLADDLKLTKEETDKWMPSKI